MLFHWSIWEGFIEKVSCELSPEEGEEAGMPHMDTPWKRLAERGKSKCKSAGERAPIVSPVGGQCGEI